MSSIRGFTITLTTECTRVDLPQHKKFMKKRRTMCSLIWIKLKRCSRPTKRRTLRTSS
ncbi:hypothetical protein METSCH_A12540 [Metschnikowia aff. pulcherrima]|uniref:Uncharacterized protein n=1 Tax=Metschnikowia aff. pulcherrima TaxID=2163413 RepID=A0A4P6XIZ2_9ASCO|nr:hypothetical protein METSCH_A12540 [Metschnikowia aff. pulcherrima]